MPADFVVLLLYLPLAAAAAGWAAERIGVPYPVLLVAVGALLSLLPWGVSAPQLSPEVVFYVFLPPLIYYSAYFIAPEDLRAEASTIGLLAVGLVLATMAAVTGVMVGIAGAALGMAAVAGAVVSPTDAVAATSVFHRLSAPERLVTILEGEGLFNDGSALVLYGAAVAATVAGTFRPTEVATTLLTAPAGGAVLGLGIAWALVWVRRRIDQPLVEITISLATPFLTYGLADAAGLSGVLATAAAGVYVGSRTGAIYAANARLQAFAFLDVLVFLLNSVLFTLVGMQLMRVVHRAPGMSTAQLLAVVVAVVAVVAVRLVWMLPGPAITRLLGHGGAPARWSERVVIGWAGMRGGVALAAAMAVPLQRADGSPFPNRDLVIVLVAAVIVITLILQGMSLPWLLSRLRIAAEDPRDQERLARLEAARAALAWLDDHGDTDDGDADDAVASVHALYAARVRRLEAADQDWPNGSSVSADHEEYLALRLALLGVERSVVLALRQQGRINATVHRALERRLDLEEARIRGS